MLLKFRWITFGFSEVIVKNVRIIGIFSFCPKIFILESLNSKFRGQALVFVLYQSIGITMQNPVKFENFADFWRKNKVEVL